MHRFLILLVFSFSASAGRFDPPDLSFEQELHRQYLRQKGLVEVPAPNTSSRAETYKIQTGENLWSLSQMLYGDGNFWPRVWAQNRSITNPHLIRPGHQLQFLLGSEDNTPAFRVSEEEDEPALELVASSTNPNVEVPPPEVPPRPVINLPGSFPDWQSVYRKLPDRTLDDRALSNTFPRPGTHVLLTAYAEESRPDLIGNFLETDTESALPLQHQYVYVRIERGKGSVGQKLLIVKDGGRVRRVHRQMERGIRAYIVQIAGEIQLAEAVPRDSLKRGVGWGYDVFRALVTRAVNLSETKYGLIPGEIQKVDLTHKGPSGRTVAQIIGAEKHPASTLYGPGEIVFLSRGSNDGLAPGQLLDVFADRTTRKRKTPVQFSSAPSGTVKVVRVSENISTAVVIKALDGILQGDRVQEVTARKVDREENELMQQIGLEEEDPELLDDGEMEDLEPTSSDASSIEDEGEVEVDDDYIEEDLEGETF